MTTTRPVLALVLLLGALGGCGTDRAIGPADAGSDTVSRADATEPDDAGPDSVGPDSGPTCPPVTCLLDCENGLATDEEGCSICECNPVDCPAVACANKCPGGYQLDPATGCPGCVCIEPPPGKCAGLASSELAGVTLDFPEQPCTFTLSQVAAGIDIAYQVLITQEVSGVIPLPGDGGGCGTPGDSGLIFLESVAGGDQSYCICDTGLCAGPDMTPRTLSPGTFGATFSWQGRNWGGPSDTGNPMGEPFPPGEYTLVVGASGQRQDGAGNTTPFRVEATFPITLVP